MNDVIHIHEDVAEQIRSAAHPQPVRQLYPHFSTVEGFEVVGLAHHDDVCGPIEEVVICEAGVYYSADYWTDPGLWAPTVTDEGEPFVTFDRLTSATAQSLLKAAS